MARSCSRRRTPTARTRRSATCSSRPSGTTGARRILRDAAPALGRGAARRCVHVAAVDRARRRGHLRDRPRAVPRPRTLDARSRSARRRGRALRHRRRRARSDLRAPGQGAARGRPVRDGRVSRPSSRPAASAPSSWPTATTTRTAPQRALDLAWTTAQAELRELDITPGRRGGVSGAGRPSLVRSPRFQGTGTAGAGDAARAERAMGDGHIRRLADSSRDTRSTERACRAFGNCFVSISTGG